MTSTVERVSVAGVQAILFRYRRVLRSVQLDPARMENGPRAKAEYWLATGETLGPEWAVFKESHADNDLRLRDTEQLCMFINNRTLSEFTLDGVDRGVAQFCLEQVLFFTFDLCREPRAEDIERMFLRKWQVFVDRVRKTA